MEAHSELDDHLGNRRFPIVEYNGLWRAVFDYSVAMRERNWLHRDVVGVVNGLQDYMELRNHKAPPDIWWKIDQMEALLFCGYNAYPEHGSPYDSEDTS